MIPRPVALAVIFVAAMLFAIGITASCWILLAPYFVR